jgi:hypothetical protein
MLWRYLRRNFLFWFGGIFAAAGLIVFAVTVYEANRTGRRKLGYYEITATTTGTHVFQHVSGGNTYYVDFRYADRDGRTHQASANASKSAYLQTTPGRQLPVYVSFLDPNDAWPAGDGGPGYVATLLLAGLGAAFFIPGAFLSASKLRQCLRSVAALEHGQYVVGRVEHIVPANVNINGRSLYCVAWNWAGPDGIRRKGKSPSLERADAMHWKPGDEIAAYIHPSDPDFAEADVFGFRSR